MGKLAGDGLQPAGHHAFVIVEKTDDIGTGMGQRGIERVLATGAGFMDGQQPVAVARRKAGQHRPCHVGGGIVDDDQPGGEATIIGGKE